MSQINHLAIIMDGNGRWATSRKRPRVYGHIKGAQTAKKMIEACRRRGISNLTLYAFSTENWQRPSNEVHFLMGLLQRYLEKERKQLLDNNIRFRCIGDLKRLPREAAAEVIKTSQLTKKCDGMNLTFALSYGGRQEITAAAKRLAQMCLDGDVLVDEITEDNFSAALESSFAQDPDLIIRTSGEQRLSNFMLWQAAYSELYVVKKHWPEFKTEDLDEALQFYAQRKRRFGKVEASVEDAHADFDILEHT